MPLRRRDPKLVADQQGHAMECGRGRDFGEDSHIAHLPYEMWRAPMLALQPLVEMPYIEIRIFLLIQTQHPLGLLHSHPFPTRMPPPIEQPGISISSQTSPPSP